MKCHRICFSEYVQVVRILKKETYKQQTSISGMVFTPRGRVFSTSATFGGKALGARLFYLIS